MTVSNKISEFMDYWCKFKCPYKNYPIFKDDKPIDVDISDYRGEFTCPKCGEEFRETIDSWDIDYEISDRYDFPDKYCECCQVEKFVEALCLELE